MKLNEICKYRSEKVKLNEIKKNEYISTDNMLSNFAGIGELKSFPKVDKVNKFYKNDILLSNIRPYFKKMILSDRESGCSSDVLVIEIINKNVTPLFLYYRLRNDDFFDYVISTSKGTKMPRGDKNAIMNFELDIPDIKIQNKIVKILYNIDKKIKINNDININLQNLNKNIYKEKIGAIQSNYSADYFKPLTDIVDFNSRGLSPSYCKEGISVINQSCIRNGIIQEEKICYHDESKKINADYFYRPYDVLINSMGVGTLGRISQIGDLNKLYVIHSCITIIRAKKDIISQLILGQEIINKQEELENMAQGTTGQTSLNNKELGKKIFFVPPKDIQNQYDQFFKNNIDMITNNIKENEKLINLRDKLLSKLMTGEINMEKIEI